MTATAIASWPMPHAAPPVAGYVLTLLDGAAGWECLRCPARATGFGASVDAEVRAIRHQDERHPPRPARPPGRVAPRCTACGGLRGVDEPVVGEGRCVACRGEVLALVGRIRCYLRWPGWRR